MGVVGELDVGGEVAVDLFVEADVVTHVNEKGARGTDAAGEGDGIIHQLVGVMGFVETEGIDHEKFGTLEIGIFGLLDGFHVCDIGQFSDAIAEDGQFAVHHLDGEDVQVTDLQGFVGVDLMESDGGNARVSVFCEAVGQHLQHALAGDGIGIDIDLTKLTVGADIVHASHMVVMTVGDEDTIDLPEGLWQDLLTEVRSTVDEQTGLFGLHQHRAAGPLVSWILTFAHLTLAPDHRYATRGSCS